MRLLAAVVLCLLALAGEAEARVIAILFDDSGSMTQRIQLPAFGAQLLVSTLDGRQGQDRLITARMSQVNKQPSFDVLDIASTALQQRTVEEMSRTWTKAEGATPFQQIETLIDAVASLQRPGEEAFLIILTDGEFNRVDEQGNTFQPPPAAIMESRFRAGKQKLKGPLRAEFLLIAASDPKIEQEVERQGIRDAILRVFNGDPAQGRHVVDSAPALVEAVNGIIARVASTDQAGLGSFVQTQQNGIVIDSPLSINRIVAVSTAATPQAPARPGTPAFPVAERFEVDSGMLANDTAPGWRDQRLQGIATHLILSPALPPGRYEVPFDRVPTGVFLLFQTDVGLRMSVLDESGQPIPAGADGVVQVPRGDRAEVALEVIDQAGGQVAVVPVSTLAGRSEFVLNLDRSGARQALAVSPAQGGRDGRASLPTQLAGEGELSASLRLQGFVTTFAEPLKVRIADLDATVRIDARPVEACATCASNEFQLTLAPDQQARPFARVTVEMTSPVAGKLQLSLERAPPWIALADAGGAAISQPLDIGEGRSSLPAALTVTGDVATFTGAVGQPVPFTIVADAVGGPRGSARFEGKLLLRYPEAKLVVTGNSQDPTNAAPLTVDLDRLEKGSETVRLSLENALSGAETGKLEVAADTWLIGFTPTARGGEITLTPGISRWCACLAWLDRGQQTVRVAWTSPGGQQSAAAETVVNVDPRVGEWGWACLVLVLLALLGVYLFGWLVAWLRAQRFPKKSVMRVDYGPREEPAFRELRKLNWTPLRALLWPFAGVPNEERTVEGLTVRSAGRRGAYVLLDRSEKPIRIEVLNQTIAEMLEENPKASTFKMNWNDSVERRDGGRRRLTLLENLAAARSL